MGFQRPLLLAIALGSFPRGAFSADDDGRTIRASQLHEQVRSTIRERIAAKIGDSPKGTHYFVVPFAYQDKSNQSEAAHTFVTVIRINAEKTDRDADFDYVDENKNAEAFTLSWLPERFQRDPTLCVFKPWISIFKPNLNRCTPEKGKIYTLGETLRFAQKPNQTIAMWGPYEISKEFFDVAVRRQKDLKLGVRRNGRLEEIQYVADDRRYRKSDRSGRLIDLSAINCFHAVGDIQRDFPKGGFLDTGLKQWGINGTRRILVEWKAKGARYFKDAIDPSKDSVRWTIPKDFKTIDGANNETHRDR